MPPPADSCELTVRVTPRSSRNAVEASGDSIRVWVTASPTDGQANDAVCRALAQALKVAPSSVSVRRGHKSRDKTLAIEGLDLAEAQRRLAVG